jgi:hypothetical protein
MEYVANTGKWSGIQMNSNTAIIIVLGNWLLWMIQAYTNRRLQNRIIVMTQWQVDASIMMTNILEHQRQIVKKIDETE